MKKISTPLTEHIVGTLVAGDQALISGTIYTARDSAHQRLGELLDQGRPLPIDLKGQIFYYVGPTPARPGQVIGSAGPTTSGRMDGYTPRLLELGLKGMIGKGARSEEVKKAIRTCRAVYFAAVGGAGVLLSRSIKQCEVVAYEDLGTEAIHRLVVENFPVVVVNDVAGRDLYEEGVKAYAR